MRRRTERFLEHVDAVDLVQRVADHDLATLVGGAWRWADEGSKACGARNGTKRGDKRQLRK